MTSTDIGDELTRRRAGYGRGARMKFERDEVEILGGVRHGRTQGGPVSIVVRNTEWPKWSEVMSPDPVDAEALAGLARNAPLTRPRPGHADLVGMQKYGFDDARPILERASARETAARVALGHGRPPVPAAGLRRRDPQPRRRDRFRRGPGGRAAARTGRPRRGSTPTRPGAPIRRRARPWSPRSTPPAGTATRSAASSRSSPTACRPGSAATCTGTGGSTPGSPPR